MLFSLIVAVLASQVATDPQVQIGPQVPPQQTLRLPSRSAPVPAVKPPEPQRPRVPIDIGADATTAEPPQSIDILAPPPTTEKATPAVVKECEDQREAGVVAGEIVVCAELEHDTSQLYSGSREAWEKAYAERTQNAGTLPPPDVAGPGIFRGPATVSGLCIVGGCPKEEALIIDLAAIPAAPEGSDAERAGQGLATREADNAPLSEEDRRRVEAELGLPQKPAEPQPDPPTQPRSP